MKFAQWFVMRISFVPTLPLAFLPSHDALPVSDEQSCHQGFAGNVSHLIEGVHLVNGYVALSNARSEVVPLCAQVLCPQTKRMCLCPAVVLEDFAVKLCFGRWVDEASLPQFSEKVDTRDHLAEGGGYRKVLGLSGGESSFCLKL